MNETMPLALVAVAVTVGRVWQVFLVALVEPAVGGCRVHCFDPRACRATRVAEPPVSQLSTILSGIAADSII